MLEDLADDELAEALLDDLVADEVAEDFAEDLVADLVAEAFTEDLVADELAEAFAEDVAAPLPLAAPLPCSTTIQLPKPPAVVKDTRHLSFDAPPVHAAPEGNCTTSCWRPTLLGFYD